jgi:uncharacterized protein YbjT (DUF2867 family)
MILVAGATGLVGNEICQKLAAKGEAVRALVRTTSAPEKLQALRDSGVELAVGDLKDPHSLSKACDGVATVVSTASSTFSRQEGDSIASVDEQGQLNLVEAAKTAGADRFVLVSFRRPPGFSFPLGDAKAKVEAAIEDMNYLIVKPSYFMESWLTPHLGFDYLNATARVYGGGTSKISWISYRDVAEICVAALRDPASSRRTIDCGGPEALTPLEVMARFEAITGKRFSIENIPENLVLEQFQAATDPMQKSFAALGLGYAAGDPVEMDSLIAEFNLKMMTVDSYAHAVCDPSTN